MAQVTGLTASRMLQIEAQSVVDGTVDEDGQLILTTHGGSEIVAGNVVGPEGPPGEGAESKTFSFPTPSTMWVCEHEFNRLPVDVTTFDNNGDQIMGDVSYLNTNTVQISWYYPVSGTAMVQR